MEKQISQILIVDDDPSLIESLSDILKIKGFEPLIALSGAGALQSIEQNHIQVAIIDLRLGDMFGLDVLKDIKSRSPDTECILLTGHSSQDSAIDAVQMGAFGYFLKPFDLEQVLLSIQRAVEKHDSVVGLRESERFAHSTVDALSAHIAILDETGTIIAVNRAWRTFAESNSPINSEPAIFEGVNYLSVCESSSGPNSEEAMAMAAGIRAVMSGEQKEFVLEYPCHSPQEQRWFNARVTRFPGEGVVRVVVAHENITNRMLAEEAVRQSEARFHALIQNAADLIVVIDAEGVIQYVSPSSERILGYQNQEFIGKKFHDWVHPEDLPLAVESLISRRENAGTSPDSIEARCRHKDGTWRVIEVLGTNLLADPSVQGIVMNIRDVTERNLARDELSKSEQRFRALIEHSADAITLLDVNGVILYESPTAKRVMKFQSDDRVGASIFDLLVASELQSNQKFFAKVLQQPNSSMDTVFRYTRSDGGYYWAEATLTNFLNEPSVNAIVVNYRDITGRKLTEDALRRNEALLSEAQRIGKIGHWEWSALDDEMTCSDELFNILEIPLGNHRMSRKTITDMVHPEDRDRLRNIDTNAFAKRSNMEYEYRILLTGGKVRWIHQHVKISYEENGKPLRILGVIQDITERKEAQEVERKNEERYRLLFEGAPVGIFSATLQGQIIEINPVALQILGSPSVEATQAINLLTFPLLVKSGFSANFKNCVETGLPFSDEHSYTSKWGKFIYAQYHMTPISNTSGEIVLIQVIMEDITERKLNEDQIRKLALMLDSAPNSVTVNTFDGKFLFVNQRAVDIHGFTQEEFMALNLHQIDAPESESKIALRMQQLRERGEAIFEVGHYKKDGSVIPLEVSARVANWGDQLAVLSVGIDITVRKQMELALRSREEQYRTLVEQLPAIVYIDDVNVEGRTLYISPQIEKILGFTPQEWQEKSPGLWGQQVHPDDFERVHVEYMRCLQYGEPLDYEYRIKSSDGRILWFRDQAVLLREDSGKPHLIQGVIYDITERKQAEESIRQRVTELELLYESGLAFIQLLHPKEIAQKIISLLEQKMDWHHTAIRMYNRETNTMQLLAFNQRGLTSVDEIAAMEEHLKGGVTRAGQGLSGWVVQHGETIRAGNLANDERYFETLPGMKSGLYVPIKLGDHVIGVVSIESEKPNAFSAADEQLTNTLANQAASTLENARLFDETRQRIMELTTLHRTGQTLLAARLDVDQIYAAVHKAVMQTMPCDAFVIVLDNEDHQEYHAVYSFDRGERYPERWQPRESGLGGRVIASGETILIDDLKLENLQFTPFGSPDMSRSILAVPLRRGSQIVGMVSTQSYQPHVFGEQQRVMLETIAAQLSSALDNANLYQQTQSRINELETLYETSKVLSAEYDLNTLLDIIVHRTEAMLNASTSGMYLFDAKSQELVLTMDTSPFMNIGLRLRLGEGLAGRVAQTGLPMRIDDYSTWEGRSPKYSDTPIHAVIEVPMLFAGELIGVLTADEAGDSGRKFTEADERLLSLFASQAAGAINAARHREDTIRYAEELEQRVLERTAEIETTRKRLDLAASAGGIGVWEINLKENTIFWDMRMHGIQGTDTAQFDNSLGAWMQTIYPEDMAYVNKQFENAVQNTGKYSLEHRIVRADDGSLRYVSANAMVIYDENHNPERMIGVNMDVTERKHAEAALQYANREMERAMRTKDEFLANMSHELRTPLNSILGISESLEEQIAGTLNQKQLRYVGIVKESGHHLLELINDILDISKIEAGRMELDLQNISVDKLCQSSLRMVKELAQKKSLKVSFEMLSKVDFVLGDDRRLKQCLVNLLSNAVKFTPAESHIGLEVCGHPLENEVTFSVWDKGIGIAEKDIKQLFKPFVQLDAGLSREYQGTGLGLALVAQMIRLHGGRVSLESEVGQGSRFTITLPWLPEQQNIQMKVTTELPRPIPKPEAKHHGRILIVEDTEFISFLMTEYLQYKGYQVFVAQNGMDGVLIAKQELPDLIIMDVMMPVMDGIEATGQIREVAALKNTPIIALTALAMPGDRERCLAAGMNDYLSKPIRIQELADMIDKHLSHKGQTTHDQ